MILELAISGGFVIMVYILITLIFKMWNNEDPK